MLSATSAAAAIAEGARRAGAEVEEAPVADGGEGTADVLAAAIGGEWRSVEVTGPLGEPVTARWLMLRGGTAVVEAAEAIGLDLVPPAARDPLRASSRGLGELLHAALDEHPDELLVCLGGTATVDGGAGVFDVVGGFAVPVRVACDVFNPLLGPRGAARVFGPQKGADPEAVDELERRLALRADLAPFAHLPGAGAAGGLGAALAALGGQLVPGADLVFELTGLRERIASAQIVVTGEGRVDRTTFEGKAPGAVLAACRRAGIRCALFGGAVAELAPGVEAIALSGDPARAQADLEALGSALAGELV